MTLLLLAQIPLLCLLAFQPYSSRFHSALLFALQLQAVQLFLASRSQLRMQAAGLPAALLFAVLTPAAPLLSSQLQVQAARLPAALLFAVPTLAAQLLAPQLQLQAARLPAVPFFDVQLPSAQLLALPLKADQLPAVEPFVSLPLAVRLHASQRYAARLPAAQFFVCELDNSESASNQS
eukprot:CAMPEP_0197642444 /NCGR_PEP_ID=MMETSP1338-20131121/16098_1 /TAXON_ID=43686 ORGANISM="Pelagodinium beii, Strain RCC1491" /NCGR_SAMPLE_ID=MMETSP1338 /ASSEMBLY_ACC=CAM_ASM_000754 /LENGTH=178 /DNA_ID=CAMNT_0043215561 /DNA_START=691 /DNA_END=1227 /DNA_ORIENTATION=-